MLVLNENALQTALLNQVLRFKKHSATQKDVSILMQAVSPILSTWEYTPNEIKSLDKSAFYDLMVECKLRSLKQSIFKIVFGI